MIIFRIIGGWLLLIAVVALVYDGTKTLGGDGAVVATPLGQHWFDIHAPSLNVTQAAIERHAAPWLWDPVITTVLSTPAWLVLALLGFAFYFIGRRRRKVDIYLN